jgi:hypothetical protein
MSEPVNRHVPLSLSRRLACDAMHFSQKVPLVVLERRMNLAGLAAAREGAQPRPSWFAVFMKAYALVAARRPELRRSYLALPLPRLYEHAHSVASVPIERRRGGEEVICYAQFPCPEVQSIADLDAAIRCHKTAPLENIFTFRTQLALSRLPRPLRRLIWWLGLNLSGRMRAYFYGTFGVTAVSSLGADLVTLLSPLSTTLTYGVVEPNGLVAVRLVFDHRVMDGANAARALTELERVLTGEVLSELEPVPQAQPILLRRPSWPGPSATGSGAAAAG